MGLKETIASQKKSREISEKIFANSVLKDKEGNTVPKPELSKTYLLYSKQSDKKIGWVKMPSSYNKAGTGWCNLPAYLKMEEPQEGSVPFGLRLDDFEQVPLAEYGIDEPRHTALPSLDGLDEEDVHGEEDTWGDYDN